MNSPNLWHVLVERDVKKQLLRIPAKDSEKIVTAISLMAVNPYAGDVVRMHGEDGVWRRRIGSYRVFFEVEDNPRSVHVFRVERRTSTTY